MICSKKTIPSQLHTRNLCIFVAYINELPVMLKDDSATQRRQEKMNKQANASAKSKELQPNAQAETVAAHLLLPQHTT